MNRKQLTLNDCNIGDYFTIPGSGGKHYSIVDLEDYYKYEGSVRKKVVFALVIMVSQPTVKVPLDLNTEINKIIKK